MLVEKGMRGFAAHEIENKMSLRADHVVAVFRRRRVPAANAARREGPRRRAALLTQGRMGSPGSAAQACFAEVPDYTSSRVLFGKPLAHASDPDAPATSRGASRPPTAALRRADSTKRGRCGPSRRHSPWNNVRMALDVARDCRYCWGSRHYGRACHIRRYAELGKPDHVRRKRDRPRAVVGKELTGASAF